MSVRFPAVFQVCLFLPISSASLFFEMPTVVPLQISGKGGSQEKPESKRTVSSLHVLSGASFGRLSSLVGRAVF